MSLSDAMPAKAGQSSISALIRDLRDIPTLSREQHVALATVIQSPGSTAEDREAAIRELETANLRLVVNIAKGMLERGEDLGDLVSDGAIGLRRAAKKFDPSRGTKFSTYASYWIRQSILRARMNVAQGRPWRVPHYMHNMRIKADRLRQDLACRGERVTLEEAGRRLGHRPKMGRHLHKLDAVLEQEEGPRERGQRDRLEDLAVAPEAPAEDWALRGLLAARLTDRLPERERRVVRWYYGLDPVPGLRRADQRPTKCPGTLIADYLGVSKQRVHQIRNAGLAKLREWAESEEE